MMITKLDLNW